MKKILNITILLIFLICLSSCAINGIHTGINKANVIFPWLNTVESESITEIICVRNKATPYAAYIKSVINDKEKIKTIMEAFKASTYMYESNDEVPRWTTTIKTSDKYYEIKSSGFEPIAEKGTYKTTYNLEIEPDEKYQYFGENNNEFEAITMDGKSLGKFSFLEDIRVENILDNKLIMELKEKSPLIKIKEANYEELIIIDKDLIFSGPSYFRVISEKDFSELLLLLS